MVWLNALTRHLQPQVIQVRERAQITAIKDSIGHVEVFQMDGVAISIIGRPRPLPGHDMPNTTHNTYTLKYEELHMVVPGFRDFDMVNISVEFLKKIQPTPSVCWGGLNG